jgi:protein O-GlcNAc transferase
MPFPQEKFAAALQLRRTGKIEDAIRLLREVVAAEPMAVEAHHQLGNALKSLGRFAEALGPLQEAVRLAPRDAAVQLNLGVANFELHRSEPAIACFRRALELEPGRPEAHNILGNALFTQGRLSEAQHCFEEALRLRANYAPAHDNLGRLFRAQGRLPEAVASFRAALAQQARPATHSNLLLALNYLSGISPDEVFAEHRCWAEMYAEPLRPPAENRRPAALAKRRLRVGYVSPDFSHHAVAYFFEPAFVTHDRASFEVFCYSNVLIPDEVTARLRAAAEHWRDIAALDDERAAETIRRDELDILIDLAGHTARNRLLVFARKPAPIQMTWLGYPNTTGLSAIDYRVTDHLADPPGPADARHSEKLLRLPGPFSCYLPPRDAPDVAPPPSAAATAGVTFGCFNNFAKVTPDAIAVWARLLAAVRGSRIFLKSRGLDDADTAARVRAQFSSAGVAPERVELDGRELSVAAHLALYARVDVALDTFPYNGATTTCEALWMGVPVVTLAGETHAARVGVSLLTHLGVTEWIATTPDEYVTIARTLAGDAPRLAALRTQLRERFRGSALCDAVGFTRSLEKAYVAAAGNS